MPRLLGHFLFNPKYKALTKGIFKNSPVPLLWRGFKVRLKKKGVFGYALQTLITFAHLNYNYGNG